MSTSSYTAFMHPIDARRRRSTARRLRSLIPINISTGHSIPTKDPKHSLDGRAREWATHSTYGQEQAPPSNVTSDPQLDPEFQELKELFFERYEEY